MMGLYLRAVEPSLTKSGNRIYREFPWDFSTIGKYRKREG